MSALILLAILLVPCHAWCRSVSKKSRRWHPSKQSGTNRAHIVRAMSWRVGLVAIGIVMLASQSAVGPAELTMLVSAVILCYPLIMLSLWQIARRISKRVFEATPPESASLLGGRPHEAGAFVGLRNITAEVRESATRANRFRLTVIEGVVVGCLGLIVLAILTPWLVGLLIRPRLLPFRNDARAVTATSRSSDDAMGAKPLAEIRAKAEKGDAQSQYELGRAFSAGSLGVAKDEVEAVKWYRKAAEQNDAEAQYNLGVCYANGQGVAKDEVEAVKWYRKAAEQNDAEAQYNLGVCYANGQGVAKDEVEAVKWFRKAAEQNHAEAQYNLGVCYANGQGVAKDEAEAVKWYRKAAEQNDAAGSIQSGRLLRQWPRRGEG